MLCQNCNKNEATTYYKETINGQTRELHLCPECAAKLTGGESGFDSFFNQPFFSQSFFDDPFFSQPFGSFLSSPFGSATQAIGGGRRCPTCGMTESELRRSGRAGCGDCYKNFSDILLPYIKKLHGAAAHVGTAPKTADAPAADPVAGLKAKLTEAVQAENYEEAARLRDEIRRLEGENK